ncbi:MAG: outer membrane lipoprotein LolB [Candidatus Competibacteraceae bacterium]|nr:MAG: outer membrane lipoprotein LolB [Candidatus Competibacteraceae bacterium]
MNLDPLSSPIRQKMQFSMALVLALLTGCAVSPTTSPEATKAWVARQSALQHLTQWNAAGRIGVVNGSEGWHAGFQWAQQGSDYRIDLIGPLGQGRVRVEGDEQAVRIQTADGQIQTAPNPDVLLEQAVGARLPVNGLRYWIRGLPEPGTAPAVQTDAEGRLIRLEQDGWIIEYLAYAYAAPLSLDLPERIMARRQELSVKLIIEEWSQ